MYWWIGLAISAGAGNGLRLQHTQINCVFIIFKNIIGIYLNVFVCMYVQTRIEYHIRKVQ